ncbi:electron-transferring-flavoprotein dehydrogenase [Oleiphilus messinensis]|uniref:Electron transfer flavoprotein-ubiquinone oxidoreductase n=1 Tax=Oleiphilus messinensis TaxID=141451 RepID=A0A1Y0IIJ0_9GAMM|nr:electron transfer flavoprotein-ubiquinone oxidoreductase [Oleiphilus messinensis]ARU59345.1 electron-transferring-flavoprotein dehydrogenase [Oleiphilus messinensis]
MAAQPTERDAMNYDLVIVGAGPSGLSAACRFKQLATQAGLDFSVCVVEKAAEIGGHQLSGAVLQPSALNELFPDWENRGAPLNTPVSSDEFHYFVSAHKSIRIPTGFSELVNRNHGNYVISIGNLCRWLAEQAEVLGVEIYPGFAASEVLYDDNGAVCGIATGDMGVDALGQAKDSFQPGVELRAKYTLFSEGCRGHLGKQLIDRFGLDEHSDTQHYALGIKEVWDIDPDKHHPGKVIHAFGWPLKENGATGGAFLYHSENNQVALGLITDLNYRNPYLSPFEELQRWKQHPTIKHYLQGGKRVAYGARALGKGGLQAIPELSFPGGLLSGCEAGFINYPKIKGNHTAMKTGMLAAESVFDALRNGSPGQETLKSYWPAIKASWVYTELNQARNVAPAMHRFGMFGGATFTFLEFGLLKGKLPFTLKDPKPDHECLKPVTEATPIHYPRPDHTISFDKLSSVYLSNTNHEEDQPCHLVLNDPHIPVEHNLKYYDEPAQRYCPAGVYEIIASDEGQPRLQINSQNCVHCKTCDIKDPRQNITWVTPEGGGGPNYPNM